MRIHASLTLIVIGQTSAFTVSNNNVPSLLVTAKSNPSPLPLSQLFSSSANTTPDTEDASDEKTITKKDASAKITSGGHDVKNSSTEQVEIDPEEKAVQMRYLDHQRKAKTLGFPVDVRTLVEYNHGFAVLCTNSKSMEGYPSGSVVAFAPDADGRPIFLFSKISPHTQNVKKDKRTSLVIASKEFKGPSDGRVTLLGKTSIIPPEEHEAVKKIYLSKHPGAFWAEFGDFKWYRMEVEDINFVGGFARAGAVAPEKYREAKPDPVSEYGMAVATHMNEDHMSSTIAMIEKEIPGLGVSEAMITSVDSLGMSVKVKRVPRTGDQPQQFKLRLSFPRQVEDRKDVKNVIVTMTREAAMAAKVAAGEEEDGTAAPINE